MLSQSSMVTTICPLRTEDTNTIEKEKLIMNINIKKRPQGEIIEEGDLVVDGLSPEESVVMLVVKN